MSTPSLADQLNASRVNGDASSKILIAPGVYDAFGAMVAVNTGFSTLYVSGASLSYSRLGRPDIGLMSMAEVAHALSDIRERVDVNLIVDADTGFGNALNVQRTVRLFERSGASAIQLEDQALPKRCGHLSGKTVVACNEMVGKLHAALDARTNASTLIVARTDAIAVDGFDAAMERGQAFVEAGADVLFIEAPQTPEQLKTIAQTFASKVPLLANIVEGGLTPVSDVELVESLGFALAIYPGGLMRAVARTAQDYFSSLATHRSNKPFADRMHDFGGLQGVLGTDELLSDGQRYDADKY